MALTPKQTRFVAEYLANGLNATKAAVSAGYSKKTAQEQGSRLLSNVMVAAAIDRKTEKRLEKLEITADRVLRELALMGFANMLDYMTVEDGRLAEFDYSQLTRDQAAAIQEITMDTAGGSGDGERKLVLRTRFKLGDKRGSLELLGKHLKLFTDKVEQSGPDGGPIQTSIAVRFVEADDK
jgi:phage terminase small subunit